MVSEKNSCVVEIVNNDGCFDLQFRKDTRKDRTNSPTYYRWKAQFIITGPKDNIKNLKQIQKEINCGQISLSKNQARFSVQKIDDIFDAVIPYFRKNSLSGKKKNDFQLWTKAVEIIKKNKGVNLANWKKSDICQLIEIHNSSAKYKNRPRTPKWLAIAKTFSHQ
jgi:hypothetical protein